MVVCSSILQFQKFSLHGPPGSLLYSPYSSKQVRYHNELSVITLVYRVSPV